jgi:Domain of unknown function (DUF4157)
MNQTLQSDAAHAQKTTSQPAPSRQSQQKVAVGGRLAQLAAMMNQSPRVQAQFKLADDIHGSDGVQKQLGLSAEMNQAAATHPWHRKAVEKTEAESGRAPAQLFQSQSEGDEIEAPATALQKQADSLPNRTGMPDDVKASMEHSFLADFSDVRVHAESPRAASLGAVALASGNDIHFAPGRYAPQSPGGQQVLGHELAHVVQQREGRVRATIQAKGVSINLDPSLERSADEQGARAARGEPVRAGRFLASGDGALGREVAQGFGLLEAGLIIGGGVIVGKILWNYYQNHYKGHPKSEEELLAGRIAEDPRAKQEIGDLLAQRVGEDPAQESEAQFVLDEARYHDLRIVRGDVGATYQPFVDDAIAELRQFVGHRGGRASEWVEGVLKRQIEWLSQRDTQREKRAGQILNHFYNKAVERFLAHEHGQRTTSLDQTLIDARFLSDRNLQDLVGNLVDGHLGERVNVREADNADRILTQAQGRPPLEKFYALARYLVNHKATKSPTQRQINSALRAELIRDITAYLIPVPAARQTTNAANFVFPQILDSATNAPVADTSAIRATATQARTEITRVVSGTVIERSGACNLTAYNSWVFRPHYLNNMVHARVNSPVKSLMHEYGHHLENNAPATRWLQLVQMLHQRSAGQQLQSIWPFFTIPYVISTNELQYAAAMPAWWDQGGWFGYSAKYYTSGHTELVSTVLEVFANHNKIINVALKDPELFIAVLKVIRE